MTDISPTKSKPLWRSLLPWLAGTMVLLSLLAICEPFVASYRTIKAIENQGGSVFLKSPDWMPEYILDRLSGVEESFYYEVIEVNFNHQAVKNSDLKPLSRLAFLQQMFLERTDIDDEGLKYLSHLTNLEMLDLDNTQVSDEGLKHLGALSNLKQLRLRSTKVTPAGLKQLQRKLPDCWIHSDFIID